MLTMAKALRCTLLPILRRLLHAQESEPARPDADYIAGTWKLVATDAGYAITRSWEDPRLGDRPLMIVDSWRRGLSCLAVLLGREQAPTYAIENASPLRDDGIVDIVRRCRGRTELVGRAPHRLASDIVRALRLAEILLRNPLSVAILIESLSVENMRHLVDIVAERSKALDADAAHEAEAPR